MRLKKTRTEKIEAFNANGRPAATGAPLTVARQINSQIARSVDRFGSKADTCATIGNVRYRPIAGPGIARVVARQGSHRSASGPRIG